MVYVTYRKVSVADEEMTCRQEAGWYRGIDMIVPLHVLCEGIFLFHNFMSQATALGARICQRTSFMHKFVSTS